MPDAAPRLTYGIEPRPGGVVYRSEPDGSVHIEVIPRSRGQILRVAGGCVAFIVVVLICALAWQRISHVDPGWVIVSGLLAAFIILLGAPFLVWMLVVTGRHRLFIVAGPAGLSVWMTEMGDPVRFEWPCEEVINVRVSITNDDGPTGLSVHLRGRQTPVDIPVYRPPRVLIEMASRIREAMKINA